MNKGIKLLILLGVLGAVVGLYFAIPAIWPEKDAVGEETTATVLSIKEMIGGEIVALEYKNAKGGAVFSSIEGKWQNSEDKNMPLDNEAVGQAAQSILSIKALRHVDTSGEYSTSFGLDSPKTIISATNGVELLKIEIGDENAALNGYYAKFNSSDNLYIIDKASIEIFFEDIYVFVRGDSYPLLDISNIQRIELSIENESNLVLINYPTGKEGFYTDSVKWFAPVDNDDGLFPIRESAAVVLANLIGELDLLRIVNYAPTEPELRAYGFEKPYAVYTLELTDEDDENNISDFVVEIGSISDESDRQRYIMWTGSDMVYAVDTEQVDKINAYTKEELSLKQICAIDMASVIKLEINTSDTLIVVEREAKQIENEQGEVVSVSMYKTNGRPAENATVESFYKQILSLEEEGRATKSSEDIFLTIDFVRNTENYSRMELNIYKYDLNFYRIEFNGVSDYLVGLRAVDNLISALQSLS